MYLVQHTLDSKDTKSWVNESQILNQSILDGYKSDIIKKSPSPKPITRTKVLTKVRKTTRPLKVVSTENDLKISIKIPVVKKDPGEKRVRKPTSNWKKTQLDQLEDAMPLFPIQAKDFWDQVSEHVDNKTARECQERWQDSATSKSKKIRTKELVYTGMADVKGKLKKKRTIRNILKHADTIQKDDLFDTNFFQSYNKIDDLELSFDESEFTPSFAKAENKVSESPAKIITNVLKPVNMEDTDTYISKMKLGKRVISETKRKEPILDKNIFTDVGKKVTFNKKEEPDSDIEEDPFAD
jgi:hypothetical protein